MVAVADLQRASALLEEQRRLAGALAQFDRGGRIIAMTVGQPPPDNAAVLLPGGVQVSTVRMSYPQSMVDTIKQLLAQLQGEIAQELQQLGVTGVGA